MHSKFLSLFCLTLVTIVFALPAEVSAQLTMPATPDDNTMLLLSFENNLEDRSGKEHSVTPHGKEPVYPGTSATEHLGTSLYLTNDAASDSTYLQVMDSDHLDLPDDYTVELWFNIVTYGTDNSDHRFFPSMIWKRGSATDHWSQGNYFVEVKGDTRFLSTGYYAPESRTYPSIQSDINLIEPGVWYHATLIRDTQHNVVVQLVHNDEGELIYSNQHEYDPATDAPNITDWDLMIGTNGNTTGDQSGFCDCFIDEIRISDVVRKDYSVPPVISNVMTDPSGMVTAMVGSVGVDAVQTVELMVRGGATDDFMAISMSDDGSGMYAAMLPSAPGVIQYYYVRATDTAGNIRTLPTSAESDTPSYYTRAQAAPMTLTLGLDFEEGMLPVLDNSTYGNQIVAGGMPTYTMESAEGDYGMQFNGDTDYLQIGSPVIGDTDEYSFEMWVNVEDFQEDQVPDGNWQFWAIKPEPCPVCWGEATFSVLTGAFDARNKKIHSRYWVEYPDGGRGNIEVPLDVELEEGTWYHILLENRKAPESDVFDYYALFQLRSADGTVIKTNHVGYNGRPLNNPDLPLRLGLAEGNRTDDGAGFQGVMDGVKYYNYSTGKIEVDAAPSIQLTGVDLDLMPTNPPEFTIQLSARVSEGLGGQIAKVQAHEGDGVNFASYEMVINPDSAGGNLYQATFKPTLGRVSYMYVSAENSRGLRSVYPETAESDQPFFLSLPFYGPDIKSVDLNFESENNLGLDVSGTGHFTNVYGAPTSVESTELGSRVLQMDGMDDYLEIQDALLGAGDAFALEIKFRVNDFREGTPEGNWMYLVNKPALPLCSFCWGEESFSLLWGMYDNPEKKLAARFWHPTFGGNQHVEIELGTSMETNVWYHAMLEVRPQATNDSLFVAVLELADASGNLIDRGDASMPVQPGEEGATLWPVSIGHIGNRSFLDGEIDDVIFYNHAALGLTYTAAEEPTELPSEYTLSQNYPNPFNPTTTIQFQIPLAEHVTLDVFDLLGRKVMTLLDGMQPAGTQAIQFDASNLSSGMYIYRIQAGDFVATQTMMFIK